MLTNHDRIAGFILMLLAASAYLYAQVNFPDAAAMYPKKVTGIMFLLALVLFGRSFWGEYRTKDFGDFAINLPRLIIAVAITGIYFVGAAYLGFFTATLFFLPGMALVAGYRNYRGLLIATAVYLTFVFVIFILIFNRPLTPELIFRLTA